MKKYVPPTQDELKRRQKEMPKRVRTNWNFFVMQKFALAYKRFHNFGMVAHYLGKKWKKLSIEDKETFNLMCLEDRKRFGMEMERFKAKYAPHLMHQ